MKKYLSGLVLILLVVGVGFSVSFLRKQQTITQRASGNVFYVAENGNDSNDGSQAHPFATIQRAANLVTPGTTVHVLSGTYKQITEIHTSGTAASPITFISDTKWGAKIATGGTLRDYPLRIEANYVRIVNFDITSPTAATAIIMYGTNLVIQGNHVHDFTGMPCSGSPGGSGLGDDATSANNTFIGNVVHNIGPYPTECQYIHGIYPSGANDIIVNNISYNSAGSGFMANHETAPMVFNNNLAFDNAEFGITLNGTSSIDGFVVNNNILIHNRRQGIDVHGIVNNPHNQFSNNLFFNNTGTYAVDSSSVTPLGVVSRTIMADPQLVSYQANGSGDYHVKSTSPAIDAGTSTNSPSTDLDGNSRPQGVGFDIGPYEFISSANNSPTTSLPTATLTPKPTNTPTPLPTVTQSSATTFSLIICPHGLGNCGDNVAGGNGNTSPKHTTKNLTLTLLNAQNQQVGVGQGTMTYNQSAKNYQGTIILPNIPSGQYLIFIKMDGFLKKQILGIISVSPNTIVSLPQMSLVTGDITNDNQVDIFDYNALLSCFGSKMNTSSCPYPPTSQSSGADMNDDGVVDGVDYNLFLREISVQKGS